MTTESLQLRCACGWEATGTEEELVSATQEHGRRVHNMLPTRDEVMAMVIRDDERSEEDEGTDATSEA